ncbi:hypothetical protein ABIB75_007718 [Bradyrhizobium sp. GM2.2]
MAVAIEMQQHSVGAPISHGRRWMLFPSTCVSPVLTRKAHAQNRAALVIASECITVLRMESLAHSIKAESRLRGRPVANFQPGKCITWNGNARFVALKLGLDEAMPEVQISLFCAFGLDAVDPAEVQMMSGQHDHRHPRRRQPFARLCRYLCHGEPASSQASNWVRFNFRRQRRRYHRMQKRYQPAPILRRPSA